jgi:hypothetical protein
VTQILKNAGITEDWYYTDEAANFGTYGHTVLALELCGALESYDPAFEPWAIGIRKFIKEQNPKPGFGLMADSVEIHIPSIRLQFAGTPDFFGCINSLKRPAILDWKFWTTATKQVLRPAGLQAAGYEILIREKYMCKHRFDRAVVHFFPGDYRIYPLTDPADGPVFMSALNIVKWKGLSK